MRLRDGLRTTGRIVAEHVDAGGSAEVWRASVPGAN
jgi:hypothetical protein